MCGATIYLLTDPSVYMAHSCFNSFTIASFCLLHPSSHRQQHAESYSQQGGEKDAGFAGQEERDGMRRYPEEGDGFLEDKVPLRGPVQVRHDVCHGNRRRQRPERTAACQDMCIGDFVERHEDRSEDAVHPHRDEEGDKDLRRGKRPGHERSRPLQPDVFERDRHAVREDYHRQVDPHTEDAPHHGARPDAKSLPIIDTGADAQPQELAQRREDGKFQETHHHAMRRVERLVTFVKGR